MKNNKNTIKILVSSAMALLFAFGAGCGQTAQKLSYTKESDELLLFKSSNEELDFFLNDYFKRHSGWIDENGLDQKVNSVTAGVNAVQFFWQEWNSMSYYWFNSYDGYETDRIEGIRKILANIPVDDYGYVWQETDAVRPTYSHLNSGEHRMGWPFPTSYNVLGSSSWDFNGEAEGWSSRYSVDGEYYDSNARVLGDTYTTDVQNVNTLEFTSPIDDYTVAYYSPLLEIDLRMYTPDCDNIEDIIVHYTSTRSLEWSSVSVKENAFINYEFTPSYEHIIFLPMYAEENWASDKALDTYINQIRVEIKTKDGTDMSGRFALNYVRSTFDTRHSNNNSIFISSLRRDYDYTGDLDFLTQQITKARKAVNFYMEMYDETRHLNDQAYFVGHDSDKTSRDPSDRTAMTLANGYWDVSFMTRYDFQSNVFFYKALVDLAYLEDIISMNGINVDKADAKIKTANRSFEKGTSDYTYTAQDLREIADAVLTELRKPTNDADKTGFWNEETGRFVGGYSTSDNKWYDYGYVMWNLEAIYYGIPTEEQTKEIMDWISGRRIVEEDVYGSQGEDIYFFEFAPRANTFSHEELTDSSIFSGSFVNPECVFGETQIQNGGAVMYLSFFDLMARLNVYGANDAYERLIAIKDWYMDVYNYYVASENYNKNPDRFYWDYYQNGAWENPKNETYYLQNGIKGTNERGFSAGVMGIDGEFLESFLVVSAIPYGFFGIDTVNGDTLKVEPSIPEGLTYWGMENLSYNKVKYDLTASKSAVRIDSVRGDAAGLQVQVTLETSSNSPKVYVNGKQTNKYTVKDGKVTVVVPLKSVSIELK